MINFLQEEIMPLLFANLGDEVVISRVGGAPQIKQHLNELGFNVGSPVTVIQKIKTGLIVKVKECRIAIDSSMASKIMI
jgi:ferrous iron transport protein A